MTYNSGRFPFTFNALQYVKPEERDYLADLLQEQGVSAEFSLVAIRRRQYWAVTLPLGAFVNEFRLAFTDYLKSINTRDALLLEARSAHGLRVRPGRVVIERQGTFFYPQHVINVLRHVAPAPAFFNALHAFLQAARVQPSLIKGRRSRNPYVPLEHRKHVGDRLARGPAWTPEEDLVLRQWFGQRTYGDAAGKHVALTDEQWKMVLERLEGRRTQGSVRARLVVLNHQLKRELSVDGYIPKNRYEEYFARVLGENPRPPRTSPLRRRRA
jgi:hypothetical protein